MAPTTPTRQAAQNQHYVPKFILRNFLGDSKKERVHVFSKRKAKGFTTSTKNIMAERRFHEFRIDENYMASFEDSICRVEDQLLPTYKSLVERRRFDGSPEERGHLAIFIAFQFLRTRSLRDQFVHLEQQLCDHLAKTGNTLEEIDGYEPLAEDSLTHQHIRFIRNAIKQFANIIAMKDFLLLSAPNGRSFYLSDNPVCLHNNQPKEEFCSNMGLISKGIQIYVPLSADLMLCAWCPSIIGEMRERNAELKRLVSAAVLSPAMARSTNGSQLQQLQELRKSIEGMLQHFDEGIPAVLNEENMDFYNSLQVGQAREHIICKNADFDLARRFVKEFPAHQARRVDI